MSEDSFNGPTHSVAVHEYERLEHTADAFVKCTGKTLEECFANAAYAMFDQTLDLKGVEPKETLRIETDGRDYEERLYNFLSELLFIEDTERMFFSEFNVMFEDDKVICDAAGEGLDFNKHTVRTEVKAVTYHMLEVNEKELYVTVLFDI